MAMNLFPQLPLLRRELTELANRRRTYVVRIVGAILLLSIVFLVFRSSMARAAGANPMFGGGGFPGGPQPPGPFRFLGIGGTVFQDIVPWLFRSIQLLMPALCCGSITMEKERNTLGTLFLTRLSPLAIVLEKLGSRLVPMLTFLLLTFPVLAYVYSLGGVDTNLLIGTLWLLLCECLLYASIGMLCSSWFRTTVNSFVCSYVLVLLLSISSAVLGRLTLTPFDIWLREFQGTVGGMPGVVAGPAFFGMTGPAAGMNSVGFNVLAAVRLLATSLPAVLVAGFCLLMARVFLFRRAFVSSTSPLMRLFKVVDRFFVQLNERTTRGIELVKDTNSMPAFDPIAWRERTRKSLGKARYLFRVLTVLEVPTIFICGLAAISSSASGFAGLRVLLTMMWVLAALVLIVKASTAISSERARETIEPLLSTPMTAAQILREKITGMRRLMIVLSIPILTINLTLLLLHVDMGQMLRAGGLVYVVVFAGYSMLTLGATFTAMLLLSWVSAGVGMRFHSQMKSVLVSVTLNAVWIVAPLLGAFLLWSISAGVVRPYSISGINAYSTAVAVPLLLTPAGPLVLNESYLNSASGDRFYGRGYLLRVANDPMSTLIIAAGVLFAQVGLLVGLRLLVLRFAPLLLGRRDTGDDERSAVIAAALPSHATV